MQSREEFWKEFNDHSRNLDHALVRAFRDEIDGHLDAEIAARLEIGESIETAEFSAVASLGTGKAFARKLGAIHAPDSGNEFESILLNVVLISACVAYSILSTYFERAHLEYLRVLIPVSVLSLGYSLLWAIRYRKIPYRGIVLSSIAVLTLWSIGGALTSSDLLRYTLTGESSESFVQRHRVNREKNRLILAEMNRIDAAKTVPARVFGMSVRKGPRSLDDIVTYPTAEDQWQLAKVEAKMEYGNSTALVDIYHKEARRTFWWHLRDGLQKGATTFALPVAGIWFTFSALGFLIRSIFDRWIRHRLEANRCQTAR